MGTSSVYCSVLCAWNRADSSVGVFARIHASCGRRIRHAIHGHAHGELCRCISNELSPDGVRGTFPGFAYQLGNLFAANTAVVEAQLAHHFHDTSGHPDYAKALGLFTLVMFVVLIFLAVIGLEKRGKEF